jgi:catalase (peroxidase I)
MHGAVTSPTIASVPSPRAESLDNQGFGWMNTSEAKAIAEVHAHQSGLEGAWTADTYPVGQ